MHENIPAGRALDALVAERIMGLNIVARDWPCGQDPEGGYYRAAMCREWGTGPDGLWGERDIVFADDPDDWPPYEVKGIDYKCAHVWPVPAYSTGIEAAWRIVETMAEQGHRMMLERLVSAGRIIREHDIVQDDRIYVCTFWHGGVHDMRGGLAPRSASAPHAICLAALRTQDSPR